MSILVTGCAGFIGFHISIKLLKKKSKVIGIDNLSDYYDVKLKKERLKILKKYKNFNFEKINIENKNSIKRIFNKFKPNKIVHLAAQAGVRYSLENPYIYINTNIVGFINILEKAKEFKCKHLVYASSSSVYGGVKKYPFKENFKIDNPISLYAATKKSNELMAHVYSHLYKLPTTGLRFFTVYGPYGRPDMSLFLFVKAIINKKKINVFNYGRMKRDFTYIDDIVNGTVKVLFKPPKPSTYNIPYRIFNIGNNNPVKLENFIRIIEKELKMISTKNKMPIQKGDIPVSFADINNLRKLTGYRPKTKITKGIAQFIKWYKDYHKIK